MTTTSATTPKPKTDVFEGLGCPHCGEVDSLGLRVEDLTMMCRDCEEDVSRADVEKILAAWFALLSWIDAAEAIAVASSASAVPAVIDCGPNVTRADGVKSNDASLLVDSDWARRDP